MAGKTLQEKEEEERTVRMTHGTHLHHLMAELRGLPAPQVSMAWSFSTRWKPMSWRTHTGHTLADWSTVEDGGETLLGKRVHHEVELDLLILNVAEVESGLSNAKPGP
jgi:hypothetical protein